jgi:hypothetical protein
MKLLSGYSIKKIKSQKNQWALIMGEDCPCCGEFTGLYVECKSKKQAIEIFNSHIPILQGHLLNSPVLIKIK